MRKFDFRIGGWLLLGAGWNPFMWQYHSLVELGLGVSPVSYTGILFLKWK